ncbi:MAG: hypothetical protein JW937_06970 [Candidatus Omnitrophica bacterium]|nr:hypothetical protein [Candidatus Omnitrophota bacterium]
MNRCRCLVGILVAQVFLFTNIGFSWALPVVSGPLLGKGVQPEAVNEAFEPGSLESLEDLQIPPEAGRILEAHIGGSDLRIIHIQDLHTHGEAQLNSANILKYLVEQYGADLICSEGAEGWVHPGWLSAFPPQFEVRERVAQEFVEAGELVAEEYLAMTTHPEVLIWGVEDRGLYLEQGKQYKAILGPEMQEAKASIERWQEELNAQKAQVYSGALLELDAKKQGYEGGQVPLLAYVQAVIASASESVIARSDSDEAISVGQRSLRFAQDDSAFPNLHRLLQLSGLESTLDLKNTTEEQRKSEAFLKQLMEYLTLSQQIDSREMSKELKAAEEQAFEVLATTEQEKALYRTAEYAALLHKVFSVKASREEYQAFQEAESVIGSEAAPVIASRFPTVIASASESVIARSDSDEAIFVGQRSLRFARDDVARLLPAIHSFYNLAHQRDEALLNNTLEMMKQTGKKTAILVTGGYHTGGIVEALKEKNISVAVIAPQVTQPHDQERYERLLQRDAYRLSLATSRVLLRPGDVQRKHDIQAAVVREFLREGGTLQELRQALAGFETAKPQFVELLKSHGLQEEVARSLVKSMESIVVDDESVEDAQQILVVLTQSGLVDDGVLSLHIHYDKNTHLVRTYVSDARPSRMASDPRDRAQVIHTSASALHRADGQILLDSETAWPELWYASRLQQTGANEITTFDDYRRVHEYTHRAARASENDNPKAYEVLAERMIQAMSPEFGVSLLGLLLARAKKMDWNSVLVPSDIGAVRNASQEEMLEDLLVRLKWDIPEPANWDRSRFGSAQEARLSELRNQAANELMAQLAGAVYLLENVFQQDVASLTPFHQELVKAFEQLQQSGRLPVQVDGNDSVAKALYAQFGISLPNGNPTQLIANEQVPILQHLYSGGRPAIAMPAGLMFPEALSMPNGQGEGGGGGYLQDSTIAAMHQARLWGAWLAGLHHFSLDRSDPLNPVLVISLADVPLPPGEQTTAASAYPLVVYAGDQQIGLAAPKEIRAGLAFDSMREHQGIEVKDLAGKRLTLAVEDLKPLQAEVSPSSGTDSSPVHNEKWARRGNAQKHLVLKAGEQNIAEWGLSKDQIEMARELDGITLTDAVSVDDAERLVSSRPNITLLYLAGQVELSTPALAVKEGRTIVDMRRIAWSAKVPGASTELRIPLEELPESIQNQTLELTIWDGWMRRRLPQAHRLAGGPEGLRRVVSLREQDEWDRWTGGVRVGLVPGVGQQEPVLLLTAPPLSGFARGVPEGIYTLVVELDGKPALTQNIKVAPELTQPLRIPWPATGNEINQEVVIRIEETGGLRIHEAHRQAVRSLSPGDADLLGGQGGGADILAQVQEILEGLKETKIDRLGFAIDLRQLSQQVYHRRFNQKGSITGGTVSVRVGREAGPGMTLDTLSGSHKGEIDISMGSPSKRPYTLTLRNVTFRDRPGKFTFVAEGRVGQGISSVKVEEQETVEEGSTAPPGVPDSSLSEARQGVSADSGQPQPSAPEEIETDPVHAFDGASARIEGEDLVLAMRALVPAAQEDSSQFSSYQVHVLMDGKPRYGTWLEYALLDYGNVWVPLEGREAPERITLVLKNRDKETVATAEATLADGQYEFEPMAQTSEPEPVWEEPASAADLSGFSVVFSEPTGPEDAELRSMLSEMSAEWGEDGRMVLVLPALEGEGRGDPSGLSCEVKINGDSVANGSFAGLFENGRLSVWMGGDRAHEGSTVTIELYRHYGDEPVVVKAVFQSGREEAAASSESASATTGELAVVFGEPEGDDPGMRELLQGISAQVLSNHRIWISIPGLEGQMGQFFGRKMSWAIRVGGKSVAYGTGMSAFYEETSPGKEIYAGPVTVGTRLEVAFQDDWHPEVRVAGVLRPASAQTTDAAPVFAGNVRDKRDILTSVVLTQALTNVLWSAGADRRLEIKNLPGRGLLAQRFAGHTSLELPADLAAFRIYVGGAFIEEIGLEEADVAARSVELDPGQLHSSAEVRVDCVDAQGAVWASRVIEPRQGVMEGIERKITFYMPDTEVDGLAVALGSRAMLEAYTGLTGNPVLGAILEAYPEEGGDAGDDLELLRRASAVLSPHGMEGMLGVLFQRLQEDESVMRSRVGLAVAQRLVALGMSNQPERTVSAREFVARAAEALSLPPDSVHPGLHCLEVMGLSGQGGGPSWPGDIDKVFDRVQAEMVRNRLIIRGVGDELESAAPDDYAGLNLQVWVDGERVKNSRMDRYMERSPALEISLLTNGAPSSQEGVSHTVELRLVVANGPETLVAAREISDFETQRPARNVERPRQKSSSPAVAALTSQIRKKLPELEILEGIQVEWREEGGLRLQLPSAQSIPGEILRNSRMRVFAGGLLLVDQDLQALLSKIDGALEMGLVPDNAREITLQWVASDGRTVELTRSLRGEFEVTGAAQGRPGFVEALDLLRVRRPAERRISVPNSQELRSAVGDLDPYWGARFYGLRLRCWAGSRLLWNQPLASVQERFGLPSNMQTLPSVLRFELVSGAGAILAQRACPLPVITEEGIDPWTPPASAPLEGEPLAMRAAAGAFAADALAEAL